MDSVDGLEEGELGWFLSGQDRFGDEVGDRRGSMGIFFLEEVVLGDKSGCWGGSGGFIKEKAFARDLLLRWDLVLFPVP